MTASGTLPHRSLRCTNFPPLHDSADQYHDTGQSANQDIHRMLAYLRLFLDFIASTASRGTQTAR